jgi:hypothetical protein
MHLRASACLLVVLGLCTGSAPAHFSVDMSDTHTSRYGPGEIKSAPCGRPEGARGDKVHTYSPGETIKLSWVEYVGHPGYYRIAFDNDGHDGFRNPASIIPAGRSCAAGERNCGRNDFHNNKTVLIDDFGRHDDTPHGKRYSVDVRLPAVECENCTLQIIQVMTEQSKAPYDPSAEDADDLYYQCIDMRLRANG